MEPGLFSFHKMAAEQVSQKHTDKLDEHFGGSDPQRWRNFRRGLRTKGFVKAVQQDDRADDKLKRFAEMVGRHYSARDPGVPVKGSTGKTYHVRYHEDLGRFSCGCNHWIYDLSHQTKKDADCRHISQVRAGLGSTSKEKQASLPAIPRPIMFGLRSLHVIDKSREQAAKNKAIADAYEQAFQYPEETPAFSPPAMAKAAAAVRFRWAW